jgi:putative phage-type endonuclease
MNCSPWFPRTPRELWLVKSGRAAVEQNQAMRRGLALEALARRHVERALDQVFEPQVVARDRISASLDGLSFDGKWVLEIKCPMNGRQSETWTHVEKHSMPPDHYWWQVQQQLYCAGAKGARFAVCAAEGWTINDFIACEVWPDINAHEAITNTWNEFFQYLDEDLPPPLTDRDMAERIDPVWRDAASAWKEAKRWLEQARRAEAEARKTLIKIAGDQSAVGAGIRLTRYWKTGEIDWRQATEGMDIEQFRKSGTWFFRISEQE